uniref:Uncharacterized protein n=1 Tax=Graphocephala atropunctata TaxID=36148 RepID=A0A1B6LNC9_9HEMI
MSKVFNSCFFWKKKPRNLEENSRKKKKSIVYVTNGPELEDIFYDYQRPKTPKYKKSSVTFGPDPSYLSRRCSLPQDRRVKSYPTSPERSILKKPAETDYLSDHYSSSVMRGSPYRHDAQMIYAANIPQASSHFNTSKEESKEPFPYHIPVSVPRRSSLFYGVKYEDGMNENPRYTAEKPIEDMNKAGFSQLQDSPGNVIKNEKHVSIVNTEDCDETSLDYEENAAHVDVAKKTILRFRPKSSGSCTPPGDTVKIMPLQRQPQPSVLGRHVHQIPLKPGKLSSDLTTTDGRKLVPVKASEDRVRSSMVQNKLRESQAARTSVIGALPTRHSVGMRDESFSMSEEEPVLKTVHVVPARKSVVRSSVMRPSIGARQSVLHRESMVRRRSRLSWEQGAELQDTEKQAFPIRQGEDPLVYAVPVVPTRGRSKSVLQQSVKSLTSKHPFDSPGVHRKNIRYSMDTDVFAAEVRRGSVARDRPGFVNMEKGQTVMVSEVLNPITSLFISDLKDTIPKDPLTKPKEANVWVQPRPQRQSFQRTLVSKQRKTSPKVHVVYQERPAKARTVQRKQSKSFQRYSRDESSSSEDSYDMYPRKSKHGKGQYYQHAVYAAQMPDIKLPDPSVDKGKNPPFKKKGKSTETEPTLTKDYCGLTIDVPEDPTTSMDTQVKTTSSEQQTDVEEETDLVCYPSEKFLKSAALNASEPGSKLRWRIIIKRGDEK